MLEKVNSAEKLAQLETLRKYILLTKDSVYETSTNEPEESTGDKCIGGVDKDDPILAWTNLHSAAVLRNVD